ncbi:LapA family protein [Bartonella bilalgolemii]|uniref:LapA family protein n=1 Tax=Bartonella bilalgolemii TaxID=2942911 RepID=A0ABT0P6F4_9HYPH|nr:LapA family protein [Bartonella sp. G70]MCL6229055.1 LapA family protein [Bartonella sp. G70]
MIIKRFLLAVILVPITAFLIGFIVANRQTVTLTLYPFQNNSEYFTYQAPLFVWLFIFFCFGILLSSITNWFAQHKNRKALKESKTEIEKLKISIANKSNITAL